tara:strand:+ start:193 stop:492 length:300 start_codon:yes stop_codon:yes gene_type:complete
MSNTKVSLTERIKRWKKSNIAFIALLFLLIFKIYADNPSYAVGAAVVVIVILSLLYSTMIIIVDIATSKSSQILEKRSDIKKEQKAVEKKQVENIDLDL